MVEVLYRGSDRSFRCPDGALAASHGLLWTAVSTLVEAMQAGSAVIFWMERGTRSTQPTVGIHESKLRPEPSKPDFGWLGGLEGEYAQPRPEL